MLYRDPNFDPWRKEERGFWTPLRLGIAVMGALLIGSVVIFGVLGLLARSPSQLFVMILCVIVLGTINHLVQVTRHSRSRRR